MPSTIKYLFISVLSYCSVTFEGFAQPVKLWAVSERAPAEAWTSLKKLETDNEGNALLLCAYEKANFDGTVAIVAKYGQDGKLQWRTKIEKPGFDKKNEVPADMVTDSSGNVYVTRISYFEDGHYHFATVKYDKAGKKMWESRFTEAFANLAGREAKILVTRSGDVYVVGVTAAKETEGNGQVLVLKYNATGNRLWYKLLKEEEWYVPAPPVTCFDKSENLLVAYRRNNKYDYQFPLAKLDANGNVLYRFSLSNNLGKISEKMPYAVSVTQDGDVVGASSTDRRDSYDIRVKWLNENGGGKGEYSYEAAEKTLNTIMGLALFGRDNVFLIAKQISLHSTGSQLISGDRNGKTYFKTDLPYEEATNLIALSSGETVTAGFVPKQSDFFRNANALYYIAKYDAKGLRTWAVKYPEEGNMVSDTYHRCLLKPGRQNEMFFAYEAAGQCYLLKLK